MTKIDSTTPLRLEAENLTLARGGRTVLKNVSLRVQAGEALIVTGPNGAGKSTLLRALAGLLTPQAGRIRLSGAPEPDLPGLAAHYVGHADAMKSVLTAAENLSFWASLLNFDDGTEKLAPAAALDRLGLAHVLDLPVGYLSAGQKRRVALARLFVAPRPVWLLDEPSTALDSGSQARLAGLIRTHLDSGGLLVAATHGPLDIAGARELRLGVGA